jgi:hypothetical protein
MVPMLEPDAAPVFAHRPERLLRQVDLNVHVIVCTQLPDLHGFQPR